MIVAETEQGATVLPRRELNDRQRFLLYMIDYQAEYANRGAHEEQLAATLLLEVARAIRGGYEAGLVGVVRAWRIEREGRG